jgi:hypothetical protein
LGSLAGKFNGRSGQYTLMKLNGLWIALVVLSMVFLSCLVYHCEMWLLAFLRKQRFVERSAAMSAGRRFNVVIFFVVLGIIFSGLGMFAPIIVLGVFFDDEKAGIALRRLMIFTWIIPTLVYYFWAYRKAKR